MPRLRKHPKKPAPRIHDRQATELPINAVVRPVTATIIAPAAFMLRGGLTVREVEDRVLRACKTVRALPDNEWRFQRAGEPSTPNWEVVRDFMDAYDPDGDVRVRFRPTPFDVSDMLPALAWCRVLTKKDFRFIWWRSFDEVSFKTIAMRIGRSDETARQRYRDALLRIWNEANIKAGEGAK